MKRDEREISFVFARAIETKTREKEEGRAEQVALYDFPHAETIDAMTCTRGGPGFGYQIRDPSGNNSSDLCP